MIADVGRFDQWPLVRTDIEHENGIVGVSYTAPYRASAMTSIIAEIRDIAGQLPGHAAPVDTFQIALKSLNMIGVSGVSTVATAAIDMVLWDAAAKEAGLPLACMLGGSIGPVRAYNCNGL